MKTTLRQVPQGVIATVDRRPKENEDYWTYIGLEEPITVEKPVFMTNWFDKLWDKDNYHTIIASTFGVGKQLQFTLDEDNAYASHIGWGKFVKEQCDKLHEYTETDNQVIIKL